MSVEEVANMLAAAGIPSDNTKAVIAFTMGFCAQRSKAQADSGGGTSKDMCNHEFWASSTQFFLCFVKSWLNE